MDDNSIVAYINRNFATTKKPLDVQIQEMRDYLTEYILENSSEIYLDAGINYTWNKVTDGNVTLAPIPQKIVFNAEGDATLSYKLGDSGTGVTATFYIYKNSVLIGQKIFPTTLTVYTLALNNMIVGDVISFKVTASTGASGNTATVSNVNVLASAVYARTLNLIEVTGV